MKNEIKKLQFLIGTWNTEGTIWQDGERTGEIKGTDSYEWAAGGFYILHLVNVMMTEKKVEVVELIGYDDTNRSYIMHSFDNEGNKMIMHAVSEKEGEIKIQSDNMRSTLNAGNKDQMEARWEKSEDGVQWKHWMDMKFTRILKF